MHTRSLLPIGCLLAVLASGCGGGGEGGGDFELPPSTTGPNAGNGSLNIVNPASGNYQTDQLAVTLSGNAFIPAGAGCSGFLTINPLPASYQVTWSNNSTGSAGNGIGLLNCSLFIFVFWDAANIPLAMGANSITVTASDGAGNVGRDTIIVTRVTDTTPPMVVSTLPGNNEIGVGRSTIVTVTFSEHMDPSTIDASTFTLSDGVNAIAATVDYDSFTLSGKLRPLTSLASNTTYQVTVTTGVQDASGGNALAAPFAFSFTTGLFAGLF